LECEILRKSIGVTLYSFIEALGWHSVEPREVGIEDDALAADRDDAAGERVGSSFGHGGIFLPTPAFVENYGEVKRRRALARANELRRLPVASKLAPTRDPSQLAA
jgi:hypothetical protein